MQFFSEGNLAEMGLAILSQLSPEDLLAMAATGSHAKVLARDRLLWKNKLKIHFPEVFATHARSRTRNWYRRFKTCYKTAYAGLTERQRRICSLIKEADVSGLKQLSPPLMLSDLEVVLPKGGITYDLIEKSCSKILQNYCYKFAESQLYATPQEDRLPSQLHQHIHNNLLLWAIICHRSAIELEQLVILGANVDTRVSVNARDDGRLTLLHLATRWGNLEAVESLIIHGVNVDQSSINGYTPLHDTVFDAQLDIAKLLVKEGADINSCKNNGTTPLCIAAEKGHVEMVSYLLEQGALVNRARTNSNFTPLHMAAQQGHLKVVKLLVEYGADINALTNKGATPLYLASHTGQAEVVRYLRGRGALMTAALSGNTPASIAKKNHHYKVLNELKLPELKNYIRKTKPHANQLRSLTLFPGVTISLEQEKRMTLMGYTLLYVGAGKIALFGVTLLAVASKEEKLEAARCLKRVVQGKALSAELEAHRKAFASGELRSLYSEMKLGL